jgi:hypothetical protein
LLRVINRDSRLCNHYSNRIVEIKHFLIQHKLQVLALFGRTCQNHVNMVTTQSLWMTPVVSIPPNIKARCWFSLLPWSASSVVAVHGTTHMEWSNRFGGRSPVNFISTHRLLSTERNVTHSIKLVDFRFPMRTSND